LEKGKTKPRKASVYPTVRGNLCKLIILQHLVRGGKGIRQGLARRVRFPRRVSRMHVKRKRSLREGREKDRGNKGVISHIQREGPEVIFLKDTLGDQSGAILSSD